MSVRKPESIDQVLNLLKKVDYVADRSLATVVYLALRLDKPLYLEGRPGVGKTELAAVLAKGLGRELIRLQCYEGLDASMALYEWNYPKQLLKIKTEEVTGQCGTDLDPVIFSEDYLLERPLLKAIRSDKPPVLLIDELDRADEEFEAFLLEILAEFQLTIPELGTMKAKVKPLVIITSNRTREINDALKRRCLFHWIDFPDFEKELAVLKVRLPKIEDRLAAQVVGFLQKIRALDLVKSPGLAETLDWAGALLALNINELTGQTVRETMGCILKHREDMAALEDMVLADPARLSGFLAEGSAC